MKINHNVIAQLANVNLKKDERRVSTSLERLSSGYKITKAADDSAGLAISNKMRTQIRALDQASRNAEDGQSIVETADGALNEVASILQRIRELSVQAANDTYTIDDRASAQDEVDQLLDEIDRISSTTEFNGKKLLDGSSSHAFTSDVDGISALFASMDVLSGEYKITVDAAPVAASVANFSFTIPTGSPETLLINGVEIKMLSTDTVAAVEEKVMSICDKMNIDVETTAGGGYSLKTRGTGSNQEISVKLQNESQSTVYKGTDAQISLGAGFSNDAKIVADGGQVTIRDNSGFEMLIEVPDNIAGKDVTLKVYDAGYMGMQIGANEKQTLNMNFEEVSCTTLSLRDSNGENLVNLCTRHNASVAISSLDNAIERVSAVRSNLGAYENRLESTVASLDVSSYNMTNAMSRIMDTDMADEMTQYTQLTVLQQAATTMLSQANNKPQEIMNLLQGM